MEKLKLAICEDTKREAEILIKILNESAYKIDYDIFSSGEELLKNYREHCYDLFLLDIYMSGITGVKVAETIRESDKNVPIAFITTSTDHTLEGYRLKALRYIEKPFNKNDIDDILKLSFLQKENKPSLLVKKNKDILKIPFSNIIYLEQFDHIIEIHTNDRTVIKVYDKIKSLLSQFDETEFFYSHKSFIVNLNYVKFIDAKIKCFAMTNNKNIPIKREDMTKAKLKLEDFIFKKAREI